MVKTKKRGTSGASKNYVTRSQAVRKLQVSLADFRRLCIFKGIYPREPTSRKRASKSATPSTTFYYTKDIQFLLHEPLLNKFRDQKSLAKKISKALGRNEVGEAKRFEENGRVRLRLDHIIKERYPTFIDALRDLDDALSMLFLFANLPSTLEVPAKTIAKCQRLTREFEWYLIRTHSLRKSFLSIKGIYYQATIQGQDILWLVPYRFVQRAGAEVDFRIMATFVDFYTTLLGFVNFRLYTSIGLVYPPRLDQSGEEQGAELGAIQLEGQNEQAQIESSNVANGDANKKAQAEADRLIPAPSTAEEQEPQSSYQTAPETAEELNDNNAQLPAEAVLDEFQQIDAAADALDQPSLTADSTSAGKLFEPHTIFLSRETPRHSLELLLKAFGCKRVGWDSTLGGGAYCSEDDARITHQIVDRPELPLSSSPLEDINGGEVDSDGEKVVKPRNVRVPGRIYVQPQWVWDSINNGKLQRPDLYAPGAELPPHLSPWVKPRKGEYDPRKTLEEQEEDGEAEAAMIEEEEEDEEEGAAALENKIDDTDKVASLEEEVESDEDGGMQVALAASDSEDDSDEDEGSENGSFGGFSEGEEEESEPSAAQQHQAELEAEAKGRSVGTNGSVKNPAKKQVEARKAAKEKKEREELEDVERRKMMMPRRKRKMYDKMVYSNARKDEKAEALRSKRRKIEAKSGKRV